MPKKQTVSYLPYERGGFRFVLPSFLRVHKGKTRLPGLFAEFGYDGQGSTRMLLASSGSIVVSAVTGAGGATTSVPQIFAYDAYGNAIGFDPSTALTSILYAGQTIDATTGLSYNRARYYDLGTGKIHDGGFDRADW